MSATKYLKSFQSVVRTSGGVSFQTENIFFRLHNKFTVGVLLGSSILLSAREFFGQPINCLSSLPKNVINTYCWISSTFTMNDYTFREIGTQAASQGVLTPEAYDDEHIQEKWRFHNYYQWVVFFLCFQAFLCYLPKYIWKFCEGGLLKSLSEGLSRSIYDENKVSPRKHEVIQYMMSHLKMHNGYVYKYWACELLCFVNIILQLFMIDSFLGGEFLQYGLKVIEFSDQDQTERVDPMIYVFPRMTKCNFHMFGSSGTIERRDSFCILPQNIFSEKIFIFIWFWYITLAVFLGCLLMYRACLIFLPTLRLRIIYHHNKMVHKETLDVIARKSSIGDWWIFYMLASTLEANIYNDVLMRLAKEIETNASNRPAMYPQACNSSSIAGSSSATPNSLPANRGYVNSGNGRNPYMNNSPPASAPSTTQYAQSAV